MIELEYLGRSGDASSVILTDAEGQRYNVAITDELRTALRRDPALVETPHAVGPAPQALRPSQIQSMLREGLSAGEIAASQGVPIEAITRYESPVMAEKAWAISRAQQSPVTAESGAPTLEDLVINRLAARGVDHHSLTWDALRRPGEDWEVSLTFIQSAVEKTATWTLSSTIGQAVALDQEANWLTETASPLTPVSAFFSPVAVPQAHQTPQSTDEDEDDLQAQEALVDQANALRGRRQPILDDISEDSGESDEGFPFFSGRVLHFENKLSEGVSEPEDAEDDSPRAPIELKRKHRAGAPQAMPPAPPSQSSESTQEIPVDEGLFSTSEIVPEATPEKKRTGSKRRPVPSWDEIVFGVRPE